MAESQSKLSPKWIAGAALILVGAVFASSRYMGGEEENATPPSPTYDAMMSDQAPGGYRVPPTRSEAGTPNVGATRLSGAEDVVEEQDQEDAPIDQKKRKPRKKKPRRESQKDEHGVERFEDGKINRKKMPPMGG